METNASEWSAFSWSLCLLPAIGCTSVSLFPGPPGCRFFTTHPCSSIGAHAVMVCVVVTQADLHFFLPSCPSPFSLPVTPLSHSSSLPATVYQSSCLSWRMRRDLRPDVLAARACDQGSWPIFHTFQHPGAEQLQTQAGCQRLYHGVRLLV